MIDAPVHPVIRRMVGEMLIKHFQATPEQAVDLATKLITTMHEYDMDIIRSAWMNDEPINETQAEKPKRPSREAMMEDRWTTLALAAEESVQERGGIKPWLPPELQ